MVLTLTAPVRSRARHSHRGGHVGAVHLTRQPVDAVVGDRDGVVEVAIAEHGDDRAEDLFLRSRIRVVGYVEHGRFEVVAAVESFGPSTAADHLAAVLLGGRDAGARSGRVARH